MANQSSTMIKWKEQAAAAKLRASKATKTATMKLKEASRKNAAKMREMTQSTRQAQAGAIAGAHATSVVAGQIDRELGQKRGRAGLARGINYVGGIGGAALAIYAKTSMARAVGASLTGMSIYQVGKDTSQYDIVPGFNDGGAP